MIKFTVDVPQKIQDWINLNWDNFETPDATVRGQFSAYHGPDPRLGTTFGGIRWEDTTEVQGLIIDGYTENGMVIPDNIGDILRANPGGDTIQNASYSALGLDGSVPKYQSTTTFNPKTGQINSGLAIPGLM